MESRVASCSRVPKETQIEMTLNLDGTGKTDISTGIGFFDHMLSGFARHGLFDLCIRVHGDLQVDDHHTIEDTGIVLGTAIKEATRLPESGTSHRLRNHTIRYIHFLPFLPDCLGTVYHSGFPFWR